MRIETVEAFEYKGDLINTNGEYTVPDWAAEAYKNGTLYYDSLEGNTPPCELFIKTVKGRVFVDVGDYVARDKDGKLFALHNDEED